MLVTVTTNPIDAESYQTFETDDICAFLYDHFSGSWPGTARIYHQVASQDHDVTPSCETDIERLKKLEGPFIVVVYPCDPYSFIAMIVVMVVSIVMTIMMAPSIPSLSAAGNRQGQSPNNELSGRTNQARPGKRIPDIFGSVRSTPDLIALPYKIFDNHEEKEIAYMCIGRGEYDIATTGSTYAIRDGETLIADIPGCSVGVYGPSTSPNSGTAQLTIGTAINEPVLRVARSNSVNGQVLRAPNDMQLLGNTNIRFVTPNQIESDPTSDIDFTNYFQADDPLTIQGASLYSGETTETETATYYQAGYFQFILPDSNLPAQYEIGKELTLTGASAISTVMLIPYYATYVDLSGRYIITNVELIDENPDYYCRITLDSPASVNGNWSRIYTGAGGSGEDSVDITCQSGTVTYSLNGEGYTILSVSAGLILLSDPATINSDWGVITTTDYMSPLLRVSGERWVGPFTIDVEDLTRVYSNFVAANGLYKDDGYNQSRIDVEVSLELTPVDSAGDPTGAAETFTGTIEGTANFRSQRAITVKAEPTFTGRCSVRAKRNTETDLGFAGTVVDEIKWRDLYSVIDVDDPHFGNVTTIQSITHATDGALMVKERKLNLDVTRRVYILSAGGSLGTTLTASTSAKDIIPFVCTDTRIGNRQTSEIDLAGIYTTIGAIETYFGTSKASEFNYTFDDDNLSFEETLSSIAQAVFCQAYRFGNVIKLLFEQETSDSTLLFNHRNKIPGSETRTISFGNVNDNDGVILEYVDSSDGAVVNFYVPEDQSAVNPKRIKIAGIRNKLQARFHAYRLYNKILYQNMGIDFESTQEAALLTRMERILVADNTRPDTQDGEVKSQSVLTLTLSQPVDLTVYANYSIFLQLYDGSVESIPVTAGSTAYEVVLDHAPRLALVMDDEAYARTTYTITGDTEPRQNAFLLTEKKPNRNMTYSLQAVNYSDLYYQNDQDYNDSVVDEDGEYI